MAQAMALLFDLTRCMGCRNCVEACMVEHEFEGDAYETTELSETAFTSMRDEGDWSVRDMCRHCQQPACASVCPVGALVKTDLGPVTYDADKCMGCRYCMVACPYNVPRYEWDSAIPRVRKCDMCFDKLQQGGMPACAEACPVEATIFGTRVEMLAEAHRRIAESPDDYYDHVYGEFELGGTSVLFLAPEPFPSLGFDANPGSEPLPRLTHEVLSKVPAFSVTGCVALAAFAWIVRRRDELAAANGRNHAGPDSRDDRRAS